VEAYGFFHVTQVVLHQLRVVSDAEGEVKAAVSPSALPSPAAHKAVNQTFPVFPLRDFKPNQIHNFSIIVASLPCCKIGWSMQGLDKHNPLQAQSATNHLLDFVPWKNYNPGLLVI
jgi:hypothetical protein